MAPYGHDVKVSLRDIALSTFHGYSSNFLLVKANKVELSSLCKLSKKHMLLSYALIRVMVLLFLIKLITSIRLCFSYLILASLRQQMLMCYISVLSMQVN